MRMADGRKPRRYVPGRGHEPPEGQPAAGDGGHDHRLGPEALPHGAGVVGLFRVGEGQHGPPVRGHQPAYRHPLVGESQAAGPGGPERRRSHLAVLVDDLYDAQVGEVGYARLGHLQHGPVVVLKGGVEDPAGGRQQLEPLQGFALAQAGDVGRGQTQNGQRLAWSSPPVGPS